VEGVRIMAAVDALRERIAVALLATDRVERERQSSLARTELGVEFDRYYDEGRTLSIEDVVELSTDLGSMPTAEFRVHIPEPKLVEQPASQVKPQAKLRVLALGPLQVFAGDSIIDSAAWGSARPRELLVYLMMHPEGRTKEQVGLAFWPEASAAQLRNSFHVTLHRLRKALGNSEWITLSNDRYQVDPSVVAEFDVAEFEREVANARRMLKRQEEGASAALERALDRFRGDLLDGEPAGDWHLEHRDRLQRIYADALMELAGRLSKEDRCAKAADAYRRLLARDDLHEEAVRALMECQVRLGERAQAMRVYQRFAERLAKELDAEPDEETTDLFERIRGGN
jgi:DNA-binding SARP family transcriptional activator